MQFKQSLEKDIEGKFSVVECCYNQTKGVKVVFVLLSIFWPKDSRINFHD